MRRLFFILLGLIFLFEIGGTVFIFKSKQYLIRKEIKRTIKQGVPSDELHTFVFTERELEKLEWKHEKEFRLGNQMFDIVRREIDKDGKHVLHCVSDEQESTLYVKLDELTGRKMSKDLPFQRSFKELTRIFTTIFPDVTLLDYPKNIFTLSYFSSTISSILDGYYHILLPPPEN